MSDFIFKTPSMLGLLPIVGVFIFLFIVRRHRRRRDLSAFAGKKRAHDPNHRSLASYRLMAVSMAVVMIVIALTRPAWNPHPKMLKREGRDVVFVLDVSNSMLAEDVLPNRLERAKIAIHDCVASFEGHRVGLVVFAGAANIKCPLTLDYEFFHLMLDRVSPNSTAQGGTRIEDALLKTCDKLFSDSRRGYKDVVLITDGGDQGKRTGQAVNALNEKGVKLIAIGIGDEQRGSRIPVKSNSSDFIVYKGEEVWTVLEMDQLRELTKGCRSGVFLPVATQNMDLGDIYAHLSRHDEAAQLGEHSVMVYDEKFQIFIGVAFVLLIISVLTPQRIRRSATTASIMFILLTSSSNAQTLADAQSAIEKNDYTSAVSIYNKLIEKSPSTYLHHNLGNAHFRMKNFAEAASSYSAALATCNSPEMRRLIIFNQANALTKMGEGIQDPRSGIAQLNEAIRAYRKILRQFPAYTEAAENLELTMMLRHRRIKEAEEVEKRQKELQEALRALRKKLESLILKQEQNINETTHFITRTDATPEHQKAIIGREEDIVGHTSDATRNVYDMTKKFFADVPPEMSPFAETEKHLKIALPAETEAIIKLLNTPRQALAPEEFAKHELQLALEALPQDPDQQQQQSQEDEDESDDEQGGAEETDEEDDMNQTDEAGPSSMSTKMDLDNTDIPPPADSPEDILEREEEIQKMREQSGGGKKSKQVEMDW